MVKKKPHLTVGMAEESRLQAPLLKLDTLYCQASILTSYFCSPQHLYQQKYNNNKKRWIQSQVIFQITNESHKKKKLKLA